MEPLTCAELSVVWILSEKIEREKRRLKDLEVFASSTTPILDGMPHAKPKEYKVERLTTLIVDCKDNLQNLKERLIQVKFDLLNRLKLFNLTELQERVLSYHYVSCLRFKEIAKLIGYTSDYVAKLHNRGLISLGLSLEEMAKVKKSCPVLFSRRQSCLV